MALLVGIAVAGYLALQAAVDAARLRVVSENVRAAQASAPASAEPGQVVLVSGLLMIDRPLALPVGEPAFRNAFRVDRQTQRYSRWSRRNRWSTVDRWTWVSDVARIGEWHVAAAVLLNDAQNDRRARPHIDFVPTSPWIAREGDDYLYQEDSSGRFRREYRIWPASAPYTIVARVGRPTNSLVTMETGVTRSEQFAVVQAGLHGDVGYVGDLIEQARLRGIISLGVFFLLSWLAMAIALRRQSLTESLATASLWRAAAGVVPLAAVRVLHVPSTIVAESWAAGLAASVVVGGLLWHATYIRGRT